MELRVNSADGQSLGRFPPTGYLDLPAVPRDAILLLTEVRESGTPAVLASARLAVQSGNCNEQAIAAGGIVNGASASPLSIAPGSVATAKGTRLAAGVAQAGALPLPETVGGVRVLLGELACGISYVSPGQVNFVVPEGLAAGRYTLSIGGARAEVIVTPVSPGIFTLAGNGLGWPVVSVSALLKDGGVRAVPALDCTGNGCQGLPLALPADTAQVYFVLYATGIRNARTLAANIGTVAAEVLFAGASQFPGVDQLNLRVANPPALGGAQKLRLIADGVAANEVDLEFTQ